MYQKIQIWTLAGICALGSQALGAEAETQVKVDVDRPKAEVNTSVDRDKTTRKVDSQVQYREEAKRENNVKRVNKATGLLGMEVRNKQGEKLGEIKDLVMDLKSGKVSYAVLAVGGFLGIGEKLLAIPTAKLGGETDGYLVLNADLAQIQSAVGFAATNWPEVENPAFDPLLSANTNIGGGANVETQTERDSDARARADVKVDTDRTTSNKLYTDARETSDRSARANVDVDVDRSSKSVEVKSNVDVDTKNPNGRLMRGTVRSVDVENRTIVIKTDRGDIREIKLDDQVQLSSTRGGRAPQVVHITDFKPGYQVNVGYIDRNGKINAYRVESAEAE